MSRAGVRGARERERAAGDDEQRGEAQARAELEAAWAELEAHAVATYLLSLK